MGNTTLNKVRNRICGSNMIWQVSTEAKPLGLSSLSIVPYTSIPVGVEITTCPTGYQRTWNQCWSSTRSILHCTDTTMHTKEAALLLGKNALTTLQPPFTWFWVWQGTS